MLFRARYLKSKNKLFFSNFSFLTFLCYAFSENKSEIIIGIVCFTVFVTLWYHWFCSHLDGICELKKKLKKFRIWVDNIKIGLHTIKPGQIIVFLHYNKYLYIICHIYTYYVKGIQMFVFPVKVLWTLLSCQNNKNHSKLIKLHFLFLQYLVLYLCYFIFLPSRISESNKIWSRNFCSKIKNNPVHIL